MFRLPCSRGLSGALPGEDPPALCRLHPSPSESQKLPFFLPEVLLTQACALVVVGTCSSWRNDLTGPSRMPRVPGGGEGRRHTPPGVIAPSERKVALEPRDLPAPPFLVGILRRRESSSVSAAVQSDGWGWGSSFAGQCCLWVIVSGSGFSCLIKVADGLRIWQSLPRWASWKQGSWLHRAPQPGSSTLLPALWIGRLLAASEPSGGTAFTPVCSAAPFHSTASLTLPGRPLTSEAGGQEA